MGKTYHALYHGTVTQLNVRHGDRVEAGDVIAKTMRTDERGRSLTAGLDAPIHAPAKGIVYVWIEQGGEFDEGDPLFRIEETL
jgi:biotin carboxyl carrier protein